MDIMDVREEDWDRIHRVNAKGVFFCMQRAARELIDQGQGGRIINIASIAGKGYAGTSNAAYAASKGAVISMTSIAAVQLGKYDINVNAICPSLIETERVYDMAAVLKPDDETTTEEWRDAMIERSNATNPLGRIGQAKDVAAVAAFLASSQSDYLTGLAINVAGGSFMG